MIKASINLTKMLSTQKNHKGTNNKKRKRDRNFAGKGLREQKKILKKVKNHMKKMPGIPMNYPTVLQKTTSHRFLQSSKHTVCQWKILKQLYC